MEQLHAVLQTWWIPLDLLVLLFFTFSFLGWCMEGTLKNIQFFADGKVAVITASLALIDSLPDIDTDDIGALANIPREIAGVEIGICVKEKKAGVFKASLRTSDNFDAAEIAQNFGGGGHARAAGCSFNGTTMEKAVEKIVKASVEAVEKQK